jgi:uncharacterized protein
MSEASGQSPTAATQDPAAAWRAFAASPAAPSGALSALELDGYLTGVIVAPSPIHPPQWMIGLIGYDKALIVDDERLATAFRAVAVMFKAIETRIGQSLRRLEAERVCDYRPAFLTDDGKPSHDDVREWVRGFWKAMALIPSEWSAIAADARTQVMIAPFTGFIDLGNDFSVELADDIEERLDEAAALIPHMILVLRKLANIRAARPRPARPAHQAKVGRNDPCPCGSGKKFKRCCG